MAAEHARVGSASPGAAAALLAAPLFHRCVAACAFEVVIGAYRMVRLPPAGFGTSCFVYKLIEHLHASSGAGCSVFGRHACHVQDALIWRNSSGSAETREVGAPPPSVPQALLDFPAVLHRLQLPAFDLCKVLEPFVLQLPTLPRCVPPRGAGRAACTQIGCLQCFQCFQNVMRMQCCKSPPGKWLLSCVAARLAAAGRISPPPFITPPPLSAPRYRDLKRHLLSVEERCLESLAWKQGSSLYAALIAAAGPAVGGSADGSSQAGKAGKEQAQGSRGAGGQGGSGGGATPRKRGHAEMSAAQGEPDAEMAEAAAAPAGTAAAAEQQAQQQEAAQPALPLSLGAETSRAGPTADAAEVEGSGGPQQGEGNAGTATWQHPSLAAQGDRSARAAVSALVRLARPAAACSFAEPSTCMCIPARLPCGPGWPCSTHLLRLCLAWSRIHRAPWPSPAPPAVKTLETNCLMP